MAGRIIIFGATGYTGDLTARALVARGAKPVLAARTESRVAALAEELGGLEYAVADVSSPASVRELVGEGDVLLSTVGPFVKWGAPAVEAAIAEGAHYLDSTGEGPFIRDVFETWGPRAATAGVGLLTAFGYDWVPGNLAGALALDAAGPLATQVDIGYYTVPAGDGEGGISAGDMSGGTRASAAGLLLAPSYAFRDGRLVTERGAKHVRSFDVRGRPQAGISVGTSEAFALAQSFPQLRDVNVYLGWLGPASRPMSVMTVGTSALAKVPGVMGGVGALMDRLVKGSTGGPDAEARAHGGSYIVATAHDAAGTQLGDEVVLEGVNGYDFTADVLAWGAMHIAAGGLLGTGALGPVGAFGLDALTAGVASAGIARV